MSLINISQTVVSSFWRQISTDGKEPKIERRSSSERRSQADRRKEQRFGDVVDRRKKAERRSE